MAASASNFQISYHTRSNSFPSTSHPLSSQVDEHLSRLRSSEATSTSSSSIAQKLNGLQDLYYCIDKFLQLSLTHQALSHQQHKNCIDELLDGSLRLLDVCNNAKDALLQTKECLHELQSIMRTKRGGEIGLAREIRKYLSLRMSLKKAFHKVLKSIQNKHRTSENFALFRDAEAVSVPVFDSLFFFMFGSKPSSRWSIVSTLMNNKRVACQEDEVEANEFAVVDAALHSLVGSKSVKTMPTDEIQSLELCIEDLEEGLETLFKCLIKSRVSILNILEN